MILKITTEAEYNQALDRLDELYDAQSGTPEWEELKKLASLIEDYEEANLPDVDSDDE